MSDGRRDPAERMDTMITKQAEIHELFEELVPNEGKAASKAGEIIRAISRIGYRFYNDGDHIGVDYGKETCNAPARYLMEETTEWIAHEVAAIWGMYDEERYEAGLDALATSVYDYVVSKPELRQEETVDMWDYFDADEDREIWDDDEEEEYEEDEYDDEE